MGTTTTRTRPDPTPGEAHVRAAGVRSIDVDARTVDVIASTETLDSHDTVLVQDWDLSRYQRNPVVLWAHNATFGMDELPIGRCTRSEVVNGALECTIHFAGADVNPRAEQVFQAFRQGFLKAVSVGFNPRSYRWEMRDGSEVLVFFDNELIELSCVPVGSNPDALARALAARKMDDMKDGAEITDDRSFIDAMIPHHEAAIEMVAEVKGKLENADLKKLASGIATAQAAEIAEMKRIRDGLDDRSMPRARPDTHDALARALSARSTPAAPPAPETPTMTEEERKRLEFAARALELLGTTDPAAGEATLRGLIDVRAQAEKTGVELEKTRADLTKKRHAEVVTGAIRDAKLPPASEWTPELRAYVDGLSAERPAPVDGVEQRSPIEAYVATLTRRAPVGERVEAKRGAAAPAARAAQPAYAKQTDPKYVERAAAEKGTRRASGFGGPLVTDHPAPEGD